MLDAVVGAVIVVAATVALALAVEVGQKSFLSAGRYPLNKAEIRLLESAGLSDPKSISDLNKDLDSLPQAPR